MIRELRKAELGPVLALLRVGFPDSEGMLDSDPEATMKVVRRVFRWDMQLVLRLARLFRRPFFRFFVVEEDQRVVATTLLTFPERAGFVSTVTVDPAYRRRGHAQALLERARVTTRASGRKYIALDVLADNAAARTLYERIGYRPLRAQSFMERAPTPDPPSAPPPAVRPFRPSDAPALVEIARRATPPEVQEVLPVRASSLKVSGFLNRILDSTSSAWVVDRGRGAEAQVSATTTPTSKSGYCSAPIVGEELAPADAVALVRTAVDWCAGRGIPRMVCRVPAASARARAALLGGGFRDVHAEWTLFRAVD